MSELLDSALTPDQRAECAKNEPANDECALFSLFMVQTKRGTPFFEAMGRSMVAVQKAHEGNCEPGQQAIVLTDAEWARRRATCWTPAEQANVDRLQSAELARMPLGGYLA